MLKTDEFVWLNVNCLNLSFFLHVFSETAKSSVFPTRNVFSETAK